MILEGVHINLGMALCGLVIIGTPERSQFYYSESKSSQTKCRSFEVEAKHLSANSDPFTCYPFKGRYLPGNRAREQSQISQLATFTFSLNDTYFEVCAAGEYVVNFYWLARDNASDRCVITVV